MPDSSLKIFGDIPKSNFFDRSAILKKLDAANRRVLSKAGAFIRTRAQTSMKRRKRTARPGEPPSAHKNPLLRKLIFFAYESATKSVVVGPTKARGGFVPNLMEKGGTARVKGVVKRYAPHAFMGPALEKERQNFAKLWKGQINKG